jgi:hypothetical protein
MRDLLRLRRVEDEALLLGLHFGEVEYDDQAGSWIMLPRFPLSPRFDRKSCAMLIELPAAYPAVPPFGVFVDCDLTLLDHYFPDAGTLNPHANQGWAWLCLHARRGDIGSWRPSARVIEGDNLLILLVLARALLDEAVRE